MVTFGYRLLAGTILTASVLQVHGHSNAAADLLQRRSAYSEADLASSSDYTAALNSYLTRRSYEDGSRASQKQSASVGGSNPSSLAQQHISSSDLRGPDSSSHLPEGKRATALARRRRQMPDKLARDQGRVELAHHDALKRLANMVQRLLQLTKTSEIPNEDDIRNMRKIDAYIKAGPPKWPLPTAVKLLDAVAPSGPSNEQERQEWHVHRSVAEYKQLREKLIQSNKIPPNALKPTAPSDEVQAMHKASRNFKGSKSPYAKILDPERTADK